MADASELYMANGSLLDDPRLHGAPMIVALSGYADAGHLAEQVRETLLGQLPSEVLASFDTDQLHDYRARRPHVRFVEDHFERIEGHAGVSHRGRRESLANGCRFEVCCSHVLGAEDNTEDDTGIFQLRFSTSRHGSA